MINKPVSIIIGAGGFPLKISAASNKYFLMAKALNEVGYKTLLINKILITSEKINKKGEYNKVEFYHLCTTTNSLLLNKIFNIIKANIILFKVLKQQRSANNTNSLIISHGFLMLIIYYRIITWILQYKLIFSIMEYHPSIAKTFLKKIKAFLFWNVSLYFADGIIPISEFLYNQIKKKHKKLPQFIIPALADFNNIGETHIYPSEKYFSYCGSIGYYLVIELIIESFLELNHPELKLKLIISGNTVEVEKIKSRVAKHENIKIYHKLSNNDLYDIYTNAIGLLIPMRPCVQDNARFPQKIAEYVASGAPIITNPEGVIKKYFTANYNAVIAKDFSPKSYCNAMRWVIENPIEAKKIGINGQISCREHFHYQNISTPYAHFLKSI